MGGNIDAIVTEAELRSLCTFKLSIIGFKTANPQVMGIRNGKLKETRVLSWCQSI